MSKYNTVEKIEFNGTAPSRFLAYALGWNRAITLDSGDVFLGGMEWADDIYNKKSVEYDMFVTGYVKGLDARFPNGTVPCDYDAKTNVYTIK